MATTNINNLPAQDMDKITKIMDERGKFLEMLPKHLGTYLREGGMLPNDETIHFDLRISCNKMKLSYEILKEVYCKDTYGKLRLWLDIYEALLSSRLKIDLVHPKLEDINNIDISKEDKQTQELYNKIIDCIENTVFNEETGDYDLNLEKIRNVYSIYKTFQKDNGSETIKYLAVFPKPKIENIEYFDGHRHTKKKLLKMKGEVIDMYDEDCFFNFIQLSKNGNINIGNYIREFNGIYNYVVKRFDTLNTIRKTESWGYFGEGKAMFKGWDINITGEKAKQFEEILNTEYNEEEVKELAEKLNEYVKNEDFSKIILEWGLASIFRYYLMDKRKLDKFPYLLIKGKQGIGKTARINILFNRLLLNTTTAYSVDDVKGSIAKMAKEQYINLPMWFDELKIFPDRLVDMLKQLGTNKEYLMTRGNKNVEKEDYRFYLRRHFLISTNQFRIDDPALLDRFIVLYAEDYELSEKNAKIGKEIFNDIHKLGAWIYDSLEEIKKEVIDKLEFESDRELANETTLFIGRALAKHIFSKFGVEYTPSERVIYGNDSVITSKDSIRHKIIEKTMKLSEYVKDGIKYNILDYYIDSAEYNTAEKILVKYGIFPHTDKIGNNYIGITKTGILHMDLRDEGIKKLSELDAHGYKITVIWKNGKSHRVALIPIDEEKEDTEIADIILDTIGDNTVHEAEIIAVINKEHSIDEEKIRKALKNMIEGKSLRKIGEYRYAKRDGVSIKERIKEYIEKKGKTTINEICIKFDIEDEETEQILKELCLRGEISKINNTTYIH